MSKTTALGVLAYRPATAPEFVDYWSSWYSYPAEHLYSQNIGQPLTAKRIRELFEWKNGSKLSAAKAQSVERYIDRLNDLRALPRRTPPQDFINRFPGGAIWTVFLLHCWQPDSYPIYDQHVHRAMTFIMDGRAKEIPIKRAAIADQYVNCYLPFFLGTFPGLPARKVDMSLWAFGKYLKSTGGRNL